MKSKTFKKLFKSKESPQMIAIVVLILAGFFLGTNINKIKKLNFLAYKILASENISSGQLKKSLAKKDFVFINVHTPYEGEIEKTDMFIAFDEMMANKDKLPKDKNAKIILYCKSGKMSAEALKTLKNLGYGNVQHLAGGFDAWQKEGGKILNLADLPEEVLPEEGFTLPISWGNLGPKLIELGVIDFAKFEKAVKLTEEQKKILNSGGEIPVKIDASNSQFVVDLLWAIGLAQKSLVYEEGPMGPTSPEASRGKQRYEDWIGGFASTGGWTLAEGEAVNYLNKFELIPLSSDQQKRVSEIAKGVFRPCCGNSTYFPDCNHGMAALAAIEMLVAKGLSDEEIYKEVLKLNSFWFPDTYFTTATYFARQGISWGGVDAREVLGDKFSSGKGAADIGKKVGPLPYGSGSGGSCGA